MKKETSASENRKMIHPDLNLHDINTKWQTIGLPFYVGVPDMSVIELLPGLLSKYFSISAAS